MVADVCSDDSFGKQYNLNKRGNIDYKVIVSFILGGVYPHR